MSVLMKCLTRLIGILRMRLRGLMKILREKQLAEAYEERKDGREDYVRKTNYLK